MATRIIANAAQLKINWSGPTGIWNNVYGVVGIPTLPTIDQALANTLGTSIGAGIGTSGLGTLLSDLVTFESIGIRSLSTANQAEFVSVNTPVAGAGVGDMLPLSLAACVTIRTPLAGKSFRGRSYITGYTEGANDANGRVSAAANQAASAFVGQVNQALINAGMAIGILSFARDAKTIPEKIITGKAGFVTAASGFQVRDTRWESQRRRTGRN